MTSVCRFAAHPGVVEMPLTSRNLPEPGHAIAHIGVHRFHTHPHTHTHTLLLLLMLYTGAGSCWIVDSHHWLQACAGKFRAINPAALSLQVGINWVEVAVDGAQLVIMNPPSPNDHTTCLQCPINNMPPFPTAIPALPFPTSCIDLGVITTPVIMCGKVLRYLSRAHKHKALLLPLSPLSGSLLFSSLRAPPFSWYMQRSRLIL